MSHPEYPAPAAAGPAEGASVAPEQAQPAKKSGTKKWASLAGTILVVGVGAAYQLTGHFGIGAPSVGDCLHLKSDTDFDQVSCDDSDADAKVVGIDKEKKTEDEFKKSEDFCMDFPDAQAGLWYSNGMITEKGTIYCVVPQ